MKGGLRVGKQQLSQCGGSCKEASAKTELYAPFKPLANGAQGSIYFNRAQFCINHGCGWRIKLPAVEISQDRVLEIKSLGIRAYFRRVKKRFPKIDIQKYWQRWARTCLGSFDAYLLFLEGQINA